MLSVLALGILNRVMKVEMGLNLSLTSLVIGVHYFAAPLAIPFGHRSDRRAYFGFRRTPFILTGAGITALATILAPFTALWMQRSGASPISVLGGMAVFFLLGVGIYSAGTAYLALISDLTDPDERGRVVAVVWSMMMVGILGGVLLGSSILDRYDAGRLILLFVSMAATVVVLTLVSVYRVEPRAELPREQERPHDDRPLDILIRGRQPRKFFLFLFSGILFLFLQNAVLEPFGGDVLGLSIAQTTRFNAFQMVGVLVGMAIAGVWLSKRLGDKATAALGLGLAGLSFGLLTLVSLYALKGWVQVAVLVMGLGMGLFNVGGLAIMMGMSVEGQTGLFMGAWTLAQALANGMASIGGGLIHDMALHISGSEGLAYGAVFAIEAGGILLTLMLLKGLDVRRFQSESLRGSTLLQESRL
jgi:BCD family chlorophyll transporter-like MFS transporter